MKHKKREKPQYYLQKEKGVLDSLLFFLLKEAKKTQKKKEVKQ